MKIFINGRFLTQPITGVQRYSRQIIRTLDRLLTTGKLTSSGHDLVCLVPPDYTEDPGWSSIRLRKVGRLHGNLWEQLDLPWHARSGLLFSPANIGPFLHTNQVVSIHDASVYAIPEAYSFTFRTKYRLSLQRSARIAHYIITCSEFSKRELIRYCNMRPERIKVIPLAGEQLSELAPDETAINRFGLKGKTYFLGIGSLSPHKNFQGLISAFQQLDRPGVDLVLVGGKFSRVFQTTQVDQYSGIHLLGYLQDAEILSLYKHAAGFVFPSFYEGFGIPVLEAMTAGCPVISSRAASLPEVGGDAVLYCDPNDPADIACQMKNLLDTPELSENLRLKGFVQASRFSWESVAFQTWEVIQSVSKPPLATQFKHQDPKSFQEHK
jgi:glycosyltransferase involved in cell wall biosynthesis